MSWIKKQTGLILLIFGICLLIFSGCSGPGLGDDDGKDAVNSSGAGYKKRESKLKVPEPLPRTVRCPLSGDMVPEGTTDRRPLAVMIENDRSQDWTRQT